MLTTLILAAGEANPQHNQTMLRPAPARHGRITANHNQTLNHNQTVIRTAPGIQLQHNQTLIRPKPARRMTANHNQTLVRSSH